MKKLFALTGLVTLIAVASPQRVTLSLTWSFRPPGQGPRVQQQPQQAGPPIPIPQ